LPRVCFLRLALDATLFHLPFDLVVKCAVVKTRSTFAFGPASRTNRFKRASETAKAAAVSSAVANCESRMTLIALHLKPNDTRVAATCRLTFQVSDLAK
jgi:hypothetical protein